VVLIDGKEGMKLITDILPKPQVQAFQFQVHISYLLQKCKKWQTLSNGFAQ
jgi:hypothetical protein